MLEGSTLGTLVELMVRAEILAGSNGRLIPSRFEPDVDHCDLIVADVGGYGAIWLQVKGTTHLDKEGRVVAFANYLADAIPESGRLLYLVCLLVHERGAVTRQARCTFHCHAEVARVGHAAAGELCRVLTREVGRAGFANGDSQVSSPRLPQQRC
jgi:hypothetical protein